MASVRKPAFHQGYADFRRGKLWRNPYNPETINHKEYQHGQDVAYLELQRYWNNQAKPKK